MVLLLNFYAEFQLHQALSWLSILCFTLISIAAYALGLKTANSTNRNDFSNVFLVITTFKLLFCSLVVWIYKLLTEPEGRLFVLPFLLIYLVFTIFESYLLVRLGKDGEL